MIIVLCSTIKCNEKDLFGVNKKHLFGNAPDDLVEAFEKFDESVKNTAESIDDLTKHIKKPLRTFEPHEQRFLANLGIKAPSEVYDQDELNQINKKCRAVVKANNLRFSDRFKRKVTKKNLK